MARRPLPPLNALRAFEAAARLGSYVAASQELHVTQPAIGRHVKALEDNLGTSLFDRTPRGVVLTDKGVHYLEQISQALHSISEASADLRSRSRQASLHLVVVPGFCSRWLRPRMADFRAQNPGVRISVELNAGFMDVSKHKADIGIGYGTAQDYMGVVRVLARPPIFPVCSPALLASMKQAPRGPADLLKLPLLHEDDGAFWAEWLQACGVQARPEAQLSYDSADQVIALALAGEGVALCNPYLVAHELAQGLLVRPVPQTCDTQAYYLVRPAGPSSATMRAFEQWLAEQMEPYDAPSSNGGMS